MIDESKQAKIRHAVREILDAIGEDPDRPGLVETPDRVARMYAEVFATKTAAPFDNYKLFKVTDPTEMVLLKDIPFYSMCEHHLLPFFGTVQVAYVPQHDQVIGLSKIPRLIDYCSQQPNVQERLTVMIAKELQRILDPAGIAVSITARHMCMEMRGVSKPGVQTESSYYSGQFRADLDLKREFLQRIAK
ncbi:GTP cyclohydrolase I FolE [Lactiplantibacillus daowaiensis]|uniref:GTP cyclohydrolase 1 n=1 Tax=Lactiplantibacillus daowaiensis TaxID=2559918 RepID=A0ABW1RZW4_9LACO|nr:GTP cyclohydrolase I FolE [Lactiplantibacillus daowaiensis]